MGKQQRLTVSDIAQWLDNDEGLYDWWKSSRQKKGAFIRENRADLERVIGNVINGTKPAHYLTYGGNR
jgi:transposase-like protein